MSEGKSGRRALALLGVVGFSLALALGITLLLYEKLSGAEFTAFVIAFAILATAVGFAPEVQEISIAGNVVKLKEIKADAVHAIESLNKSRVEMLRVFFGLAMKHEGGFASVAPIDPRAMQFWGLVDLAREYGCLQELRTEVLFCVESLLYCQMYGIKRRNRNKQLLELDTKSDPLEVARFAFDDDGIAAAESATSPRPENYRAEIKIALNEYSKLFNFKRELEVPAA